MNYLFFAMMNSALVWFIMILLTIYHHKCAGISEKSSDAPLLKGSEDENGSESLRENKLASLGFAPLYVRLRATASQDPVGSGLTVCVLAAIIAVYVMFR